MKFRLTDRQATFGALLAAALLFFHPYHSPNRPTKQADCTKRSGRVRELVLREGARRVFLWLRLCDTLVIANEYSRPLYPAPGPHPHHDSYPELDVQRSLAPDERFSVQLIRPGNYQLHDNDSEKVLAELTILGIP